MALFGKGITVASGFDLAGSPVDSKYIVDSLSEANEFVESGTAYEGMQVFNKEDKTIYVYVDGSFQTLSASSGTAEVDLSNYVTLNGEQTITGKKTFEEIKNYWVDQAKTCACLNVVLGIIGNKSDLFEKEEVTEEEAREFAKSIGAFFMLTSAKHGTGIHEAFKEAAEMIEQAGPIQERGDNNNVKLGEEKKREKKCFK